MENVNCSFVHTPAKVKAGKPEEVDCGFKAPVALPGKTAGPQGSDIQDELDGQEDELPSALPKKRRK